MAEPQLQDAPWLQAPVAAPLPNAPFARDEIAESLQTHFKKQPRIAQNLAEFYEAGFQNSNIGLIYREAMPDLGIDKDTPWYGRALAGLGTMTGDFPTMIAGFIGGSTVSTPVGGAVVSFAAPAAVRSALVQYYEKGEVQTAGEFMDRVLRTTWETFKGGAVGAATVLSGGAASTAIRSTMLPTAVQGAARVVVPTAAEVVAMTATHAALEGHLPSATDFLDAAILVGGLKAAVHVGGRMMGNEQQAKAETALRDIYEQTGEKPVDVALKALKDDELAASLRGTPIMGRTIDAIIVRDDVRTKLEGVGYTREEALLNAEHMAAFFDTVGDRVGKSPLDLFRDYKLTIERNPGIAPADALTQSVYHGSPFEFDNFSLQKIGSGEGAQVYGWGLYFAGNKAVAQWYRDHLSPTGGADMHLMSPTGSKKLSFGDSDDPLVMAHDALTLKFPSAELPGDFRDVRKPKLHGFTQKDFNDAIERIDGRIKALEEGKYRVGEESTRYYVKQWKQAQDQLLVWKSEHAIAKGDWEFNKGGVELLVDGKTRARNDPEEGQQYANQWSQWQNVLDFLQSARGGMAGKVTKRNLNDAIDIVKEMGESFEGDKAMYEDLARRLQSLEGKDIEIKKGGRLYHVEIPDPENFLHLDKPLTEQTQKVKDALIKAGLLSEMNERQKMAVEYDKLLAEIEEITGINNITLISAIVKNRAEKAWPKVEKEVANEYAGSLKRDLDKAGQWHKAVEVTRLWDAMHDPRLAEMSAFFANPLGKELYQRLVQDVDHPGAKINEWAYDESMSGKSVFGKEDREISNEEAASRYLNSLGIPGVTYYEGASRAKGGTDNPKNHNYVLFDDSLAKIVKYEQQPPKGWDEVPGGPTPKEQGFTELPNAPGVFTAKGYISFGPDRKVSIALLQKADASTFIHESGHFYFEVLRDLATKADTPAELKADFAALTEWLGVGKDGLITREHHEKFARGFEAYIMEGKAPSPKLASVFEQFKQMLMAIYKSVTALGVELSPEARGVFDRMFRGSVPRQYEAQARADTVRNAIGVMGEEEALNAVAAVVRPFGTIPQAKGEPTLPHHINYNFLNSPQQVMQVMARVSELYEARIQAQRRGTVSNEQTMAEAEKMLGEVLGKRLPGAPTGPADVLARKWLVMGAAEDMASRAREIMSKPDAEVTPKEMLEYIASIERLAMIQSQFLGARAELGRGMQILKETTGIADKAKHIQELIDTYGGDPRLLARMVTKLEDPAQAAKFARQAVKATTYEQIIEAFKASILSGYQTHLANLMGNTVFMAMQVPIDVIAATIGTARRVAGGEGGAYYIESVARMAGFLNGAHEVVRYAAKVLGTPGELKAWLASDAVGPKAEQFKAAIPGVVGKIVRTPFKALAAEDAMFQVLNKRGEAMSQATRQAVEEGLNPLTREFRERVVDLMENDAGIAKLAEEAALRFTFNKNLGPQGQALQAFIKQWHLEWVMPFVRTPGNILKELARMVPGPNLLVKEWKADWEAGGAKRDRAVAELVMGGAVMATVVNYALGQGNKQLITGQGNPDPNKRRVQLASGWQPYSIKIGDTYYSYQRLQPIGTLMGLAADMAEVWDKMDTDESDKAVKMVSVAFANAVTNQTFLQGLTNAVGALSEPDKKGVRWVASYAGAVVPAMIAQPTTAYDPYVREVRGILDAVRARIPTERDELPIKHDIFGEPMMAKDRAAGLLPTSPEQKKDKVRMEAARLGVGTADAPKKIHLGRNTGKIGDVKIDSTLSMQYQREGGQVAKAILDQVVNDPDWDSIPDIMKRKIYTKAFMTGHKYAAATLLPEGLREQMMNEIMEKFESQLTVEER